MASTSRGWWQITDSEDPFSPTILPLIEGMILVSQGFSFFRNLKPLWVSSSRPAASEVFGAIEDHGGAPMVCLDRYVLVRIRYWLRISPYVEVFLETCFPT